MTNEELDEIKSHLKDNTQNWSMTLAQQDRIALLAEVDRLRERMSTCSICGQDNGKTTPC